MQSMEPLGRFADAGQLALETALDFASRSLTHRRIPIAGCAVHLDDRGHTTVIGTGVNGRIPEPGSGADGYPTDHGETAAIRNLRDIGRYDWHNVVFATTLSPCAMCARSLMALHRFGLRRIVVAESDSFPGRKDLLETLPEIVMIELTSDRAKQMMADFSTSYPWDWAADIGEIPARSQLMFDQSRLESVCERLSRSASEKGIDHAAVMNAQGDVLSEAKDLRETTGGNPTYSGVIQAVGRAGSSINLRECAVVHISADPGKAIGIEKFGDASLGACEVFRPGTLVTNATVESSLLQLLEEAGVANVTIDGC